MSEADKIIKNLKNSGKKVEEFYVSNKTSDKNVGSIEEDVDELKSIMNLRTVSGFAYSQKNTLSLQKAIKNVLTDYTRQKQINEEHQKINGELREKVKELEEESRKKSIELICYQEELENSIANLAEREQKDKRIQKLEEENMKLKAQHIFTKNKATDKEKAELYDTIDKTLDTFLEEEKPMWEQEMIADKMKLEEALNIVDAMYQDKYKMIEENNTIYVDRLKDVKFTNLEFASVILLREVQSLQSKLKNSIPKQVVIDVLQNNRNELFSMTYLSKEQYRPYEMQVERINKIEQELLGEDK